MKSQIAHTSQGPIEYTCLGNGPVVLVGHGTSSDRYTTIVAGPLVKAGFTGHFFWIGPDFGPVGQRMVEFLWEKS